MRKHVQTLFIIVVTILGTLVCVDAFKSKKSNSGFNTGFGCATEDITDMYADYIFEWKLLISKAFDSAEMKVFGDKPTPDIVGPHPDPDKCICGGKGVIIQGDGHKTVCPYHGKKDEVMKKHGLIFYQY